MDEIEVPLENLQEDLNHHATHGSSGGWITWSALLSALLAVFAAIAALLAGKHANEAMINQIQASDRWAFYQAKSIKTSILETRREILQTIAHGSARVSTEVKAPGEAAINEKIATYQKEQSELQVEAKEREEKSAHHFESHETFAHAVTLFQIAIAITAISVLARRRKFLWVSGAFGFVGTAFLILGLIRS